MSMRNVGCVSAVSFVPKNKKLKQYHGKKILIGTDIPWTNDKILKGVCSICNNNPKPNERCCYCDREGVTPPVKKILKMNFYPEKAVA